MGEAGEPGEGLIHCCQCEMTWILDEVFPNQPLSVDQSQVDP